MDSHADTCVAGANFLLVSADPDRSVNVSAFDENLPAIKDVPMGTAATLWQDPLTGRRFILEFNEVLFFGDRLQGASLLNPNQMRLCGGARS